MRILRKVHHFLQEHRVRLTFLLAAALIVENWARRSLTLHTWLSPQDAAGMAGAALVLAGVLTRSWAAGVVRKNQALATAGPYSLARHPLYVGSLLIAIGFGVLIGDVEFIAAVLVLLVVIYVPIVKREEATMATLFGQAWQDYVRRTGPFFPRTWRPRLAAEWSLRTWLRNGEWRAFATGLVGLAAIALLAHGVAGAAA